MFKKFSRIIATLTLVMGLSLSAFAQINSGNTANTTILPKDNSPLSRFGLGQFLSPYTADQQQMGGTGIAYISTTNANLVNPAALAFLANTSLEGSINVRNVGLEIENQSQTFWAGNLQYLSLSFPLKNPINLARDEKKPDFTWGMNLSIQPYTNVGYNVDVQDAVEFFGTYTNSLKGTGGTYKLNWGNGFRYKNLAVGVNASYVFGKITNSRRVSLDSLNLIAYSTEFLDEFSVSGFQFKGGVQYTFYLDPESRNQNSVNKRRRIVIGATASNEAGFTTNVSQFYSRDNFGIRLTSVDTLLSNTDVKLTGVLPSEYGFGLTFERINNFKVSAEYNLGNWSNYSNDIKPDVLADSYRLSLGAEWIPDITSYNRYLERIRYRVGGYFGTDPRSIAGQQIEMRGATLGVSLPIERQRQALSFIHLGFEFGQMEAGNLIKENFAQFTFGFSLNDNTWFFKRKFN